jgi:hypothetical protein
MLTDIKRGQDETTPVVKYHTPQELYNVIDLELPLEGSGVDGN